MFLKDDDELVDYAFVWGNPQTESGPLQGDTITASSWTVTPVDLVKVSDTFGTYWTKIWVQGGTHGTQYILNNKITTTDGRILERSIKLLCKIL